MAFCTEKQPMITHHQSIGTAGVDREVSSKKAPELQSYGVDSPSARIRKFSYEELAPKIKEGNYLGTGAYGKVYKVSIGNNNETVAVKKLNLDAQQGHRDLLSRGVDLTQLNHPNVIKLFEVVDKQDEILLVYEFMQFGSVADHLFGPPGNKPFDWNTKMKIAAGAARGLQYLHSKGIIHCDVKSSNIFLDDECCPKLSDFGTYRKGYRHGNDQMHLRGIVGYCAPEYMAAGEFILKSDVYSLGVVLLELISGRRVFDFEAKQCFFIWDIGEFDGRIDPVLKASYPPDDLEKALSIAQKCVKGNPKKRPNIEDVINVLTDLAA